MAIKFTAREVLVLATEDDCSGRSNSENRECIIILYGPIHAYRGKTRFSTEGFKEVGVVMGEAIPGPGPCTATLPEESLRFLGMNYRKKINIFVLANFMISAHWYVFCWLIK